MKLKAYAKLIQPSTDSWTNHHKGIEHASLSVNGSIKHLGTIFNHVYHRGYVHAELLWPGKKNPGWSSKTPYLYIQIH